MDNPIKKLDESRPYGTAFVGTDTYFVQDGKHFHRTTKELVDPLPVQVMAIQVPVAPMIDPPVVMKPDLICKLCGAGRASPELMKEHLMAMHKDEVPELQITADAAKGQDETVVAVKDNFTGKITNVEVDKTLSPGELADLQPEPVKPTAKKTKKAKHKKK